MPSKPTLPRDEFEVIFDEVMVELFGPDPDGNEIVPQKLAKLFPPDSKWSHLARRRSQTLPLRARGLISAGSAGDARSAVMRSRRRSTGRWGRGQSALPIVAPQLCFGEVLAGVRFVAFPRTDLAGLRALPRVAAFPLRAAAGFFR